MCRERGRGKELWLLYLEFHCCVFIKKGKGEQIVTLGWGGALTVVNVCEQGRGKMWMVWVEEMSVASFFIGLTGVRVGK